MLFRSAMPVERVLGILDAYGQNGIELAYFADTTGMADPRSIAAVVEPAMRRFPQMRLGLHLHNTRGLGLANALAAYEEGVRHFDSSMGGLGGCPFAPGASGNVITEDLVFMFEAMGIPTGINFEKLFEARKLMIAGVPDEPVYGQTPNAGLPKGFRAAA